MTTPLNKYTENILMLSEFAAASTRSPFSITQNDWYMQLLPLRVDPFLEGERCAGMQMGIHNCYLPCKTLQENLPLYQFTSKNDQSGVKHTRTRAYTRAHPCTILRLGTHTRTTEALKIFQNDFSLFCRRRIKMLITEPKRPKAYLVKSDQNFTGRILDSPGCKVTTRTTKTLIRLRGCAV